MALGHELRSSHTGGLPVGGRINPAVDLWLGVAPRCGAGWRRL